AALTSGDGTRPFGILIEYAREGPKRRPTTPPTPRRMDSPRVGLIGAGAFARATLLPALKAARAELVAVASEGGLSAADVAERFGFGRAASVEEVLADDAIGAVVIATRHSSHATLAAAAL